MKKRMRILTFLLAGAMVFTGVPGTGMLAAATGTVVAQAVDATSLIGGNITLSATLKENKAGASAAAVFIDDSVQGSAVNNGTVTTSEMKVVTSTAGDDEYVVDYTGNSYILDFTLKDSATEIASSQYDISYAKINYVNGTTMAGTTPVTEMKDAGKYMITIRGKGAYTDSIVVYFTIDGMELNINETAGFTATQSTTTVEHTGAVVKPSVTVKGKDSNGANITLVEGKDYEITVGAGDGTTLGTTDNQLKVTGLGNYLNHEEIAGVLLPAYSIVSTIRQQDVVFYLNDTGIPTVEVIKTGEVLAQGTGAYMTYGAGLTYSSFGILTGGSDAKAEITSENASLSGTCTYTGDGETYVYKTAGWGEDSKGAAGWFASTDATGNGENKVAKTDFHGVTVSGTPADSDQIVFTAAVAADTYTAFTSEAAMIAAITASTSIKKGDKDTPADGTADYTLNAASGPAGGNGYSVSYYNSQAEAEGQNNAVAPSVVSAAANSGNTYYARIDGAGNFAGTVITSAVARDTAKMTKIGDVALGSVVSYTGNQVAPSFTVRDARFNEISSNNYVTVISSSDNYAVNTNSGATTSKIFVYGDNVNTYGKASIGYCIMGSSMDALDISVEGSATYDGNAHKAAVEVKTTSGEALIENLDYTVSYHAATVDANGNYKTDAKGDYEYTAATVVPAAAGKYVVVVTGMGSYDGSRTFGYEIEKANLSDLYELKIGTRSQRNGQYSYSGKVAKGATNPLCGALDGTTGAYAAVPEMVYVVSKDTPNSEAANLNSANYLIAAETINQKEAGHYTVTVIPNGNNYTGTLTAEYDIVEMVSDVTAYTTGSISNGSVVYTPHVLVKNSEGDALVEGTDYTVEYYETTAASTDSNSALGAALDTITVANGRTKYVQAQVTLLGNYGSEEKTLNVSMTLAPPENGAKSIEDAEITFTASNLTYTGKPITLNSLGVKSGTATLVSGTDYKVAYSNNQNAGTATVMVYGCGEYVGSVSRTFEIGSADLTKASVAFSNASDTYNGLTQTLGDSNFAVTVNGSLALKEETDFSVAYYEAVMENGKPAQNTDGSYQKGAKLDGMKNVGTYIVEITGTRNYHGFVNTTFAMSKGSLDDYTITAKQAAYTGEAVVPVFEVRNTKEGKLVDIAEEYSITIYASKTSATPVDAVEKGTYYAVLAGKGNNILETSKTDRIAFEVVDAEELEKPDTEKVEELQKELDAAKEELEAAKKELQDVLDKNEASQAEVEQLKKEVADQQAAVDELKQQIEELQNQARESVEQTITVTKKKKSFKASNLKSKKGTFNIKAAAQTDLSYKTMKANNKVTVKANGKVVVKKGTKAGTYKVRVRAVATKSDVFKKAIKNFTVTVVVK